jgi:glycosyltransferase involved in cell wall biosynthesis
MTKPRICLFTETYYPVVGGGETQAQLLAEGLVAKEFAVIIVTRRSDAALKKIEQVGPVTVYRLPPVGGGQLKKWGLLFSSFWTLIQLRNHYDLIFVSGFRIVGVAAVLVSKLFGKRCVLKADSQGEMSGTFFTEGLTKVGLSPAFLPFKLFLGLRNRILKRAAAFTAITPAVATELTTAGIPANQIYRIPNSVDTERFFPVSDGEKSELRRKLNLPQSGKLVIYTGRLVSYKGLPLLLRVWHEIQSKHKNAVLLLVGTGGLDIHNCEAELRHYVNANHLQHAVYLPGTVRNVPAYLQASDLFVLPTENDAFPSSLIEAMSCQLPGITTPVGAIKTIITDQQNGLLVEPGDFQQLYTALDRLLTDRQVATHLGQAGRQTVQARYSAKIVTQTYATLFCQVAGGSGESSKFIYSKQK